MQQGTVRKKCHGGTIISSIDLKAIILQQLANGYEYDDDELLVRIKNLKLPITFVAEPYVIHQYHDKLINPNNPPISVNNKSLFYSINEAGHIRAEHNHYLNLK